MYAARDLNDLLIDFAIICNNHRQLQQQRKLSILKIEWSILNEQILFFFFSSILEALKMAPDN